MRAASPHPLVALILAAVVGWTAASGCASIAPREPVGVTVTRADATVLRVAWTSPPAPDAESAALGYRVYRDSVRVATVASSPFNDSGVVPGAWYAYTVRAYDQRGESVDSRAVLANTHALPNPPAVSVSYNDVGAGDVRFRLSWSDPGGEFPIEGYAVRASYAGGSIVRRYATADTTWLDASADLTAANSPVEYGVAAFSAVGTGAESVVGNLAYVSYPSTPPSSVTFLGCGKPGVESPGWKFRVVTDLPDARGMQVLHVASVLSTLNPKPEVYGSLGGAVYADGNVVEYTAGMGWWWGNHVYVRFVHRRTLPLTGATYTSPPSPIYGTFICSI